MAQPKLNFLEKIANLSGVLYRYHAAQFPRRWDLLKKVAERELAPPTTRDLPVIKKEFQTLYANIKAQKYRDLSVKEFLVYTAVAVEVACWFFAGEIIGRRNINGYLIPADYVSKKTRKEAAEYVPEDKHNF